MSILYGETSVQVLEDSIDIHNQRITTFLITCPRIILAEFNTHNSLSRNVGSSRAKPFNKILESAHNFFFLPKDVRKNSKGMESLENLSDEEYEVFQYTYETLFEEISKTCVNLYNKVKVHKQTINRLIENFTYVDIVATGNFENWQHFVNLRAHSAAQPEIQEVGYGVKKYLENSIPNLLYKGELHLPFISEHERKNASESNIIKASISRIARTSIKTFDGIALPIEEDVKLYHKLVEANPPHSSPLESIAQCTGLKYYEFWDNSGNFHTVNKFYKLQGWKSFRFLYEKEGVRI